MPKTITSADVFNAAAHLAGTERGKAALGNLRALLSGYGDIRGLDSGNRAAVVTIISGALGEFSGTAKDAILEHV